jgi:hypothetical protein
MELKFSIIDPFATNEGDFSRNIRRQKCSSPGRKESIGPAGTRKRKESK